MLINRKCSSTGKIHVKQCDIQPYELNQIKKGASVDEVVPHLSNADKAFIKLAIKRPTTGEWENK